MIVDSSALVAVIKNEPERREFLDLLGQDPAQMSVATWLETCLVLDKQSPGHAHELDLLVDSLQVAIVPVSLEQGWVARDAHRRYGRGSGHPARLNYGDCFAYALAITTGDTLLFKGADFARTDVRPAL